MTTPNITLTASPAQQFLDKPRSGAGATFKAFATRFRKGFANFITRSQIARMESCLATMTDEQLDLIGIKRSEIKKHATALITYEYDGL